MSEARKMFAIKITRKDGTWFFASAGPGEARGVWSPRNRKYATQNARILKGAGMNAKVVPVLYAEPTLL